MVEVRQSTIIDAPIEAVWAVLRDFNGHDRWHPAIASSAIEGGEPTDVVGAVRRFRLRDGGELREQLLALSDEHHSLTYCLLQSPLPLMGYVASIRLRRVTDGDRTFWDWRSSFEPPPQRRAELIRLVSEDIYQAGFTAIRHMLRVPPPGARAPHMPSAPRPPKGVSQATPVAPATAAAPRTKAIIVERYGGPEVMQLRDIALPDPLPDQVRIHHTCIGVNYIDVYCRSGYFDLMALPGTPGVEAAGVVEAVGTAVKALKVGDRVAYACLPVGSYCERRNMSPDLLVSLSDDISDEIASAALLKGITASFLTGDVHAVKPGELVLIYAAAGGVGQLLAQWVQGIGATVIGVVSTPSKAEIVRAAGVEHVVVTARDNVPDAVMRISGGRGVDVVYDAVGRDTFEQSLAALAPRGHLVSFGQASGEIGARDIGRLASKSVTLSRPNYGHYTDTPDKLRPHIERFFAAIRSGAISVAKPTSYALANAADAHRDLESRRTTGSLVLMV